MGCLLELEESGIYQYRLNPALTRAHHWFVNCILFLCVLVGSSFSYSFLVFNCEWRRYAYSFSKSREVNKGVLGWGGHSCMIPLYVVLDLMLVVRTSEG